MKIEEIFLTEERSNPNLNPRVNVMDMLSLYGGTPNTYVHFSSVRKLGINPKINYATPIGVYSYPMTHVQRRTDNFTRNVHNAMEFLSDRPYVYVIRHRPSNPLVLQRYRDYDRDSEKVLEYILNTVPNNAFAIKNEFRTFNARFGSMDQGRRIWNLIYTLIDYTSERTGVVSYKILHKVLGYDMVLDMGDGIIHTNEPYQAVHFVLNRIEVLDFAEKKAELPRSRQQAFDELANYVPPSSDAMRVAGRSIAGERFQNVEDNAKSTFLTFLRMYEKLEGEVSPDRAQAVVRATMNYGRRLELLGKKLEIESSKYGGLEVFVEDGSIAFLKDIAILNKHMMKVYGAGENTPGVRALINALGNINTSIDDIIEVGTPLSGDASFFDDLSAIYHIARVDVPDLIKGLMNR